MSESDEIITLVNRNNQVIGDVPRRQMNFEDDIHRVTFVLVFTGPGTLLLQKRTENKAFCPGYYGVTTGGVVSAGESYDLCAQRELEEELGLILPLNIEGMFFTEGEGFRIWGKVYSCHYNKQLHGPLTLQAKEVAEVIEMDIKDILNSTEERPFTPDSLDALLHFVEGRLQDYPNVP